MTSMDARRVRVHYQSAAHLVKILRATMTFNGLGRLASLTNADRSSSSEARSETERYFPILERCERCFELKMSACSGVVRRSRSRVMIDQVDFSCERAKMWWLVCPSHFELHLKSVSSFDVAPDFRPKDLLHRCTLMM